jgi:hypothetical protein
LIRIQQNNFHHSTLAQAEQSSLSNRNNRDDNCQVQVLGPQHFLNAVQAHFIPEVDSLGDRIRWASLQEAEVIEGLKSIDKTAPKALTDGIAMWEEDNGFIYYKGRLYMPNDRQLH